MNSYNKSYLDKIAKEKGFLRDNLEKVIRLTEVLRHFNQSELLNKSLVLKGGTAINLTVFQMPRLSVDIDLDFAYNCSREEMLTAREIINRDILAYMGSEGYALKPGSKTPHALDSWVFGYINAGGNPDNIKIEINYSDRCHVLPVVERAISIDFLGDIKVRVLSPVELFASKINALISRAAVRDIYDVYGMITAHLFESEKERQLLRRTLVFYLAVGSSCKAEDVTLCFNDFRQIDSLSFSQVRAHLLPVLRNSEKFDFQKAKEEVASFMKQFLVFSEEEHEFIRCFNDREYCPGILFPEGDIAESLKTHPMALWKCRPKV
ncbi:MAG: nucleotidyl transferase AbiEii/AbiGii toxin family protein [Bacteroides sp.]|nr:nucleotidyl transferase AbiEii/AbiGii toxin family protein [Bacteroides sp.]